MLINTAFGDDQSSKRAQLFARGFLVFPSFLSQASISELIDEVGRLCKVASEQTHDGNGSAVFLTDIERQSDIIFDAARSPEVMGFTSSLLGTRVVPVNVELFARAPHSFDVTPPHQDHAFYRRSSPSVAVTVWIALDDVTEDSGALEYAEGYWSHSLAHRRWGEGFFAFELEDSSGLKFKIIEVPRGGCIIHHSFAVHRSGPNKTDRPRRAIAFSYRGAA